jgi:hypothetical protein
MEESKFMVKVEITEDKIYNIITFQTDSSDIRQYLEEKLLGILVPSLQQLIKRYFVESQDNTNNISHELLCDDSNPINYLAMELMRNHPKYNHRVTQHPYYRKLMEHHSNK